MADDGQLDRAGVPAPRDRHRDRREPAGGEVVGVVGELEVEVGGRRGDGQVIHLARAAGEVEVLHLDEVIAVVRRR